MLALRHSFSLIGCSWVLLLSSCLVNTHKNGKSENVDVGTPFGGVHVKTDDAGTLSQTGLTPYPGAVPVKKHNDDNGSADVNVSFGSFHLGVQAAELQTSDNQDKVISFYRKDMARYGAVLLCHGSRTVGSPARTADGLTCSTDQHGNDDSETQLRAGSPLRQYIVGIHTEDHGTRIGLVALQLPPQFKDLDKNFGKNFDKDDDRE